jgi:hypothetical protein
MAYTRKKKIKRPSYKHPALQASNLELQAELDRLSLDQKKNVIAAYEKDESILTPDSPEKKTEKRFLKRLGSRDALLKKYRKQGLFPSSNIKRWPKNKKGGKIMQGYKAGGKV